MTHIDWKKSLYNFYTLFFHDCCWGTFGNHWSRCPNYTEKRNTKRLRHVDLSKVRPEDRHVYEIALTDLEITDEEVKK